MGKGGGDFGLFQPNILCKIERFAEAAACRRPPTLWPPQEHLGPAGIFDILGRSSQYFHNYGKPRTCVPLPHSITTSCHQCPFDALS